MSLFVKSLLGFTFGALVTGLFLSNLALKEELARQKDSGLIVECNTDQGQGGEPRETVIPGFVCVIRPIKTAPVDVGK